MAITSPQGQWVWDESKQDWVPNAQTQTAPSPTTSTSTSGGMAPDVFKKIALMDLLTTGGKNLSSLKAAQDLISPAPTADEQKLQKSFNATTNFVDLLEQRFQQAGGGEYSGAGARLSGAEKTALGRLGLNSPAKVYEDQRRGFAATLKQLTGDTGVLTERDFSRLSGLVPNLGATPEEAQQKFTDLRSQIAASFGGKQAPTTYKAPQSKGGLADVIVPGLSTLFKGKQQEIQTQGVGVLPKQSAETLLPFLNLFRPGGLQAAGEVATGVGVAQLAGKGISAIKGLTVKGALEKRTATAAATGAKASGDTIYSTAEKMVRRTASETDLPQAEKYLAQAKEALKGKDFAMQDLLDKLAQYNKAYTTAGRAGKSAKALVNDALSKAARQEIQNVAPEVSAAQQGLKRALGLQKTAKSVGSRAAYGAGAVGVYGLLRMLGIGGGGNVGQ